MTNSPQWLIDAAVVFGDSCAAKLAGPGDKEAAIRSPLETFLGSFGTSTGVKAVFHDEVRDSERRVRPDYGVSINGAISGYVEVKAPQKSVDPDTFRGHDKTQWERQKDLPNLIYTNGTEWRLYRNGELCGQPEYLNGGALDDPSKVLVPSQGLEALLLDFLKWHPSAITSVGSLVRAVAPLTRLLRGEVLDQIKHEEKQIKAGKDPDIQPFLGLAQDWRALLFPSADNATFADGYAQTVTFGLLLARTENIDIQSRSLHSVGSSLGAEHSLMGKALQLLTDDVAKDFKVTLDLLVRVIGAVNWEKVRKGRRDTYLHLYENFLDLYDNELRKKSGSYYTPREVVEEMTRLTEDVLVTQLGKSQGFRDQQVLTIDPAMGTGTFLHTILERVAASAEHADGPGAVAGAVTQAAERLIGFELQMGPYAVAELRAHDLLALHGAKAPSGGMKLFVTDTLDDPHAEETQLGSGLKLLAKARKDANKVKAEENVTVVIGNPPYKELATSQGGWVANGSPSQDSKKKRTRAILEDFFSPAMRQYKAKLKNLYIYFWRWATWKTWESTTNQPDSDAGVVCFISTSGYVTGRPFVAMREYLRRESSDAWIIDLTPEGQTPDVPTRIFPMVRQPLSIGIFVRKSGTDTNLPARIRYVSLHGRQKEKFDQLAKLTLNGPEWKEARTGWTAPFTPASLNGWDDNPALDDLLPWYAPGIFATRTWIYSPSPELLNERWARLIAAPEAEKPELFKEGSEPRLHKSFPVLPGADTSKAITPLAKETNPVPTKPLQIGYRSFERQWIIPDSRAIHRAAAPLWAARQENQVYTVELHTQVLKPGPGIVFSSLIPDYHHFKGSEGGRVLPALHPDGSANLAPKLVSSLEARLGLTIAEQDVLAYVAAVVSHAGYTSRFAEDLQTPGVRVPITTNATLWTQAVELGREVLWAQTYGSAYSEGTQRPKDNIRFANQDPRRVVSLSPVTALPEQIIYDAEAEEVHIGDGRFGPIPVEAWEYQVGGKSVIKSWFSSRNLRPGGLKSSPLDHMHVSDWQSDWNSEFIDLASLLRRLSEHAVEQQRILDEIMGLPLISMEDLEVSGTVWPEAGKRAKPIYSTVLGSNAAGDQQGEFDLTIEED